MLGASWLPHAIALLLNIGKGSRTAATTVARSSEIAKKTSREPFCEVNPRN